MTRKNFYQVLLGLLPLALLGANKKVCYPVTTIWETPQGKYVLMLRDELKRLNHWDDLEEDWKLVEDSLKNGHLFYDILPSREQKNRLLYNVRPVYYAKIAYGEQELLRQGLL